MTACQNYFCICGTSYRKNPNDIQMNYFAGGNNECVVLGFKHKLNTPKGENK